MNLWENSWVLIGRTIAFVFGLVVGILSGLLLLVAWVLVSVVMAAIAIVKQDYEPIEYRIMRFEDGSRAENIGAAIGQVIGMWGILAALIIWLATH